MTSVWLWERGTTGRAAKRRQAEATEVGIIVVPGIGIELGIPCDWVKRIVAETEWKGESSLDLGEVAKLPVDRSALPRCLLELDLDDEQLFVQANGKVGVRYLDPGEVQPVPQYMFGGQRSKLFTGLVFAENQAPLFLVDVNSLRGLAKKPSERQHVGNHE